MSLKHERLNYPCNTIPGFDIGAAFWAAKTIYYSAQLMLYRENKDAELEVLLPSFPLPISASAQLSADLMLRFLPDIIEHLKMISPEDALIPLLEKHLIQWHYSGIKYSLNCDVLNFPLVIADPCLMQLYIDRGCCASGNLSIFFSPMRPTLTEHHIAITEALNAPALKEQIALRESIPHMYLLNLRCDCIAVMPALFRFRITLDYSMIRNREIPHSRKCSDNG